MQIATTSSIKIQNINARDSRSRSSSSNNDSDRQQTERFWKRYQNVNWLLGNLIAIFFPFRFTFSFASGYLWFVNYWPRINQKLWNIFNEMCAEQKTNASENSQCIEWERGKWNMVKEIPRVSMRCNARHKRTQIHFNNSCNRDCCISNANLPIGHALFYCCLLLLINVCKSLSVVVFPLPIRWNVRIGMAFIMYIV